MDKKLVKSSIFEGIRVGLVAFMITFAISLVFSIITHVFSMEDLNTILNGSMVRAPKITGSSIISLTSFIMNMTVFNGGGTLENGGTLHIGILSFALVPIISFIIADQRDNKKETFDLHDMIIYSLSSIIFAVALYLNSYIAKGSYLDLDFDHRALSNLFMTVVVVMFLQLLIGMNYNKAFTPGVRKARFLLRIFVGVGLLVGLVVAVGGTIFIQKGFNNTFSIFLIIWVLVLMIPNIAIYFMFTVMGASFEFGPDLVKLINYLTGRDLSFASLPVWIRLICVTAFFAIVLYSVLRLDKEKFIREVLLFASAFSFISFMLSYCTLMNLGFITNYADVSFGFNKLYVALMPFVIICLAGALVYGVRALKKELKA